MSATRALGFGVLFACATVASAQALAPDRIFERNAPGVWLVRALDAQDKPLSTGSGVVVAPGKVATSCQLLARAQKIELRQGNYVFKANLEFPDVERDLCQLQVSGLAAAALTRGSARSLRIGQRIYVVGHQRGSDQSLNEGLVSSLRAGEGGVPQILTSIAAARGLLGGGLFDEEGRLGGIVTASPKDAPNALFAAPVEWIDELPARATAALAARRSAPAGGSAAGTPASPALPAVGATYRYQWADRQYGRQQEFTVRIQGIEGWNVNETLKAGEAAALVSVVPARDLAFAGRRLAAGQSLLEFAPYLPLLQPADLQAPAVPLEYPDAGSSVAGPWSISLQNADWDPVTVPAGSFRAIRISIRGSRQVFVASGAAFPVVRFEFTAWYSPDHKRYVKSHYQRWDRFSGMQGDDHVELLEYRAN
jgi:S1-C subfamily serine protease